MKVKVLSRNPDDYMRETKKDIYRIPRNLDPVLHPFVEREYVRSLNSVKLERVFAKPFIGNLDGHRDGITCLKKHPTSLSTILSGSYDGEIRIWNVPKKTCVHILNAHSSMVRDICIVPSGDRFFSVGSDKNIKEWKLDPYNYEEGDAPISTILCKTIITGIDHHWKDPVFATCGEKLDIWDELKSEPVRSFSWGADTINSVKYNQIETYLLAATSSDRSITLYDSRSTAPIRKVILTMKSNAIAWNPMEAFIFTAANEDFNLYTFDIRKLNCPLTLYTGHIAAVLDVDYSPTGNEFVSGSFDRTLRIFPCFSRFSREIYHTKRMQRVTNVQWMQDSKFVLSASDEMNIRIWKSHASEKLGALERREKASFNYSQKLKEKYADHPQIRRIASHRHLPSHVYKGGKVLRRMFMKQRKKKANREAHSKPGTYHEEPFGKQKVVEEQS